GVGDVGLELLRRLLALGGWMGEEHRECDREMASSHLRKRLVGHTRTAERRMDAEVPVLLDAFELATVDRVDEFEVLGGLEQGTLDLLHVPDTAGQSLGLRVLDLLPHASGPGVTVVGELRDLADDVGRDRRPGGRYGSPGGTSGVTAPRFLDEWADIGVPDLADHGFHVASPRQSPQVPP